MASAVFSTFQEAIQTVRQYEEETNNRFVVSRRRKAGTGKFSYIVLISSPKCNVVNTATTQC